MKLGYTRYFFVLMILTAFLSTTVSAREIGSGSQPAISGNTVVWVDNESRVCKFDLITDESNAIDSINASNPAVYGDKVVWREDGINTSKLVVYDIPSQIESNITKNVDQFSKPAIYGSRIVWSANYNETTFNSNIYSYDIATSRQTRIASGDMPDIYDGKITYVFDNGDGRMIAVYDIATRDTTEVPFFGDLGNPHMAYGRVLFSDTYTRRGYLSIYDLMTGNVTLITHDNSDSGDALNPDAGSDSGLYSSMYGDRIVYTKMTNDRFGDAGIHLYNISTAEDSLVFGTESDVAATPDISGRTIVWGYDNSYGANTTDDSINVCTLSA